MRKLTRSILATTAVVGLLAIPVGAGAENTTVTFELTGGDLRISQDPADPVPLGTSPFSVLAQSFEGDMNDITVTDTQSLAGSWCVSVGLSDANASGDPGFENGASELDGGNATMWVSNVGVPTGAILTAPALTKLSEVDGVTMDTGGVVAGGTTALGGGTLTYTPRIKVTIPANEALATGTYSGVVTHTASTSC